MIKATIKMVDIMIHDQTLTFDFANMNAEVLGQGSLTRFLDKFEPRFTFRIENILNDRLIPYFQRRGYIITNPDDYDNIFNMEKP